MIGRMPDGSYEFEDSLDDDGTRRSRSASTPGYDPG